MIKSSCDWYTIFVMIFLTNINESYESLIQINVIMFLSRYVIQYTYLINIEYVVTSFYKICLYLEE